MPEARIVWIDATRGASVAAVVLFHVCLWWYLPLTGSAPLWDTLSVYLGGVRMPLLLALSGLVAARGIRAGLGDTPMRTRAVANAYLYAVWVIAYAIFYAFVPGDLPHRITGPADAVAQLAAPETPLWFLYALPLYAVGLAAARRIPPVVVLVVLACLAVVMRPLEGPTMWPRVLGLAFFFAVGVYAGPLLRTFAARVTPWSATGYLAGAVVVGLAGLVVDTNVILDGVVFLVRGIAFILAAIAAISLSTRWGPFRVAAQAVGRRTLPIYVLHVPLLAILIVVTPTLTLTSPAVALAVPVVVTALVVAAALTAERLLIGARLGFLFAMPLQFRAAIR